MREKLNGNNEIEIRDPLLSELTRDVKGIVGGEEGDLAAEHEELRFGLGESLIEICATNPAVFAYISQLAAAEISAADPQQFVDTHLTAPEDSALRQRLTFGLSSEPRARDFVRLLRNMERLVTTP